jgi:hypothetical protein
MKRSQFAIGLISALACLSAHAATYVLQVSMPNYPPQQLAGDDSLPFTTSMTFERPEVISGVVRNTLVDYALTLDARSLGNDTSLTASFTQRQSAGPAPINPALRDGRLSGTGTDTITSCREFRHLTVGQTVVLPTSVGPIRITPVRINPIAISPSAGSALPHPNVIQMTCGAEHPGGLSSPGGSPAISAPPALQQ